MLKDFITLKWLNAKTALFLGIFLSLILFLSNGEPYVRSDGYYYFHTAECIINEGNFYCNNQPEYWGKMDSYTRGYYDGKFLSVTAPGTSLLNVPALWLAEQAGRVIDLNNDYFIAYNGHTLWKGVAILLNSLLFTWIALVLIYNTLRNLKFGEKTSILATGLTYLSSYAIWYVFLLPIFTHSYELFGVSLLLYSYLKSKENHKYNYLIGVAIGLLVLIRPVLLPIGLLFCLLPLLKRQWKSLLKVITAGIPFALIYLIYNYLCYGSFISSGYDVVRSESFNFQVFNGFNLLFSASKGWLIYSPLMFLGLVGLFIFIRKQKELAIISLLSIFSLVVIYGFWPAWGGGGGYGSRFMIFAVPFVAIGVATLANVNLRFHFKRFMVKVSTLSRLLIFIAALFSICITLLYRIIPVTSYEFTPIDFFKGEYSIIESSNSFIDFIKRNAQAVRGGSGVMALLLGISNEVLEVKATDSGFELKMLSPFYLRRPLPEKIEFVLVNNTTGKQYIGEYFDPATDEALTFTCVDGMCGTANHMIILKFLEDKYESLPVGEYIGFDANNEFRIYFKDAENVQFSGNRLGWTPDEGVYNI